MEHTLDDYVAEIRAIARKVRYQCNPSGRGLLEDDLEQEGLLAAWQSLSKATCCGYVLQRARWAMLDAVRSYAGSRPANGSDGYINGAMLSADEAEIHDPIDQNDPLALASAKQALYRWNERLDQRDRKVMDALSAGESQAGIAEAFDVTPSLISQRVRFARERLIEALA